MGLLEKASARRNLPKSGLRARAEEYKDHSSPADNKSGESGRDPGKKKNLADTAAGLTELCDKIDSLAPSLEGIVELFEDVKQLFSIKKGAFLTKNRDERFFLPRAQTGLDVTSRNRLRFPADAFSSPRKGTWLSFDDYSFLEPFLSSREYELLEDLRMLAIRVDDEPAGMILLFGEEPNELDYISLAEDQIEALQLSLGNYLRRNKLLRLSSPGTGSSGSVSEIKDFLRKIDSRKKELTAIRFSLNRLLIHLAALSADVDLFRARRDSLRIIETLFEGSSRIVPLKDDEYLLLLGTRQRPNPKLLQHQVRLALQNFFSDNEAGIDFHLAHPPAAFDSLEELIAQYPPEKQP
ncbi:hypothetical protein [Marispirochaeta aestuarii]|uniref:hypothetical protein n=1 Tax=Marispirochaeta aestuarii TaxID=1963862 RepID=UPI0029C65240|nr:hypothetical protein [Marispirochaeta aestuarii]